MKVLETERLILRRLSTGDAEFMLGLLNDPSWLRFIGDRGVRTLEDARAYILKGPVDMYDRLGFGLYLTELKDEGVPIGICGLVKRDSLEDVDIGFALLPGFWGQGYAFEAASAVMEYGKNALGLKRIVAITARDNHSSIKLLEKLGLKFERMIRIATGGPEIRLFAWDSTAADTTVARDQRRMTT
ncbi:MAG: GNAT family N-acetyltransferase [Thermoanaerobaculia bacterium]